jgi:hypothetical protein
MADNDKEKANRAAEDRKAAIERRNATIDEKVREGREQMAERNAPIHAAEAASKPTPTPEECDAAILGHHIVNKEDDGSGPDHHLRRAAGPAGAAPYLTRDSEAGRREVPRESGQPAAETAAHANQQSAGQQHSSQRPADKDADKKK